MSNGEGVQQGPVKVLVVGGSYGGLSAALNLLDLCHGNATRFPSTHSEYPAELKINVQITVVDERDGYYHIIGSPLALASREFASKAWTRFADIPALQSPNFRFVQGSLSSVDPQAKVATISTTAGNNSVVESYDYLVAASGLRRVWPVVPQSLTRTDYLNETGKHIKAVENASYGVVVIGGGAVGIEMAAEIKHLFPEQTVRLVHSREQLLSSEPLPDDFKVRALEVLRETGVEVILGKRVSSTSEVTLEDGKTATKVQLSDDSCVMASEVIMAISKSTPTSSYLPAEALDEEGYVKIAPTLNFSGDALNNRYHFAIGDIAAWSGIRRCGGAMHMGHYAAINIHQVMLNDIAKIEPKYTEIAVFPAVIGLAVATKAVCYSPGEGTTDGEVLMGQMFGTDLGFSICWNYMRLSEKNQPLPAVVAAKAE